ncbi:uncharacterized protein LOC113498495 [Trichoplusia ni]|uniref:Uncharacterized protein LOC113498495 n=1 Tax=Trichoplusia ni TaxID=7111 RepID=A0A7E5W1Z5_TRINI|nr:uncharacterized protein LOC113498495 [Trichoplusia ni]
MLEPFYDLTKKQSMVIKRKVERAYDETIFSKDSKVRTPNFRKKTLMNKGVIEMCCEDEFALEWLRKIIAGTPSPRSDAKLVVRRQRELQNRLQAMINQPEDDSVERHVPGYTRRMRTNTISIVGASTMQKKEEKHNIN